MIAAAGYVLVVSIGLCFFNALFGGCYLAIWVYGVGRFVVKEESPWPWPCRFFVAVMILLSTVFVALMPWLFFGGEEGCREFDPAMPTRFGMRFEEFWIQTWIFSVVNAVLAVIAIWMSLADHPPSKYIRESIRCTISIFLAVLLKTAGVVFDACQGADLDNDGLRDYAYNNFPVPMMVSSYGTSAGMLSAVWCMQFVVDRLLALERSWGEPLPGTRSIIWLSRLMMIMLSVLAITYYYPIPTLIFSSIWALEIIVFTVLIWRAYSPPVRALRTAAGLNASDGVNAQLDKEVAFALKVIGRARAGTVVAGVSMSWHIITWGTMWVAVTKEFYDAYMYSAVADTFGNVFCVVILSAASLSLPSCLLCKSSKASTGEPRRGRNEHVTDRPAEVDQGAWDRKVAELASRRITLGQLLDFHARLGSDLMPHFDPRRSTTNDVVRHAVIPESRVGELGKSLAEVLPKKPRKHPKPPRMVTHHWANRFSDLVAVVVANGLGSKRWDSIAESLRNHDEKSLKEQLEDKVDLEYWLCAICINQHASICGNSMGVADTVTKEVLPSCNCSTPKFFNEHPGECELNKFDDMMAHLHRQYSGFLQVVAVDRDFNLFTRAWCVAELAEAHASNLEQHVVIHSPQVLEEHSGNLSHLKVQECNASRAADKEAILQKIGTEDDIEEFNQDLQQLLVGDGGLLAGWLDGQALLQEVGEIAARAKARMQKKEATKVAKDLHEAATAIDPMHTASF